LRNAASAGFSRERRPIPVEQQLNLAQRPRFIEDADAGPLGAKIPMQVNERIDRQTIELPFIAALRQHAAIGVIAKILEQHQPGLLIGGEHFRRAQSIVPQHAVDGEKRGVHHCAAAVHPSARRFGHRGAGDRNAETKHRRREARATAAPHPAELRKAASFAARSLMSAPPGPVAPATRRSRKAWTLRCVGPAIASVKVKASSGTSRAQPIRPFHQHNAVRARLIETELDGLLRLLQANKDRNARPDPYLFHKLAPM
jgi:hypothetical protein